MNKVVYQSILIKNTVLFEQQFIETSNTIVVAIFILKMLKKSAPSDWEVLGKSRKPFWGSNRLEPDIVLKKEHQTYIIDTKWKIPGKQTSIQDLRQLYAYGRFWKSSTVMLLYPGKSEQSEEHEFQDDLEEGKVTCHKAFVSVLKEANVLDEEIGKKIIFKWSILGYYKFGSSMKRFFLRKLNNDHPEYFFLVSLFFKKNKKKLQYLILFS